MEGEGVHREHPVEFCATPAPAEGPPVPGTPPTAEAQLRVSEYIGGFIIANLQNGAGYGGFSKVIFKWASIPFLESSSPMAGLTSSTKSTFVSVI